MAKRREIALMYEYNENWIGGTYYIQNLISALNLVPDDKKPTISIFSTRKKFFDDLNDITAYPYLNFLPLQPRFNVLEKAVNKIWRTIFKKPLIVKVHEKFDLLFPAAHTSYFLKTKKHLYWIPDFQEHHLPQFFTKEEVKARKDYQMLVLLQSKYILFSSKDAQKDFNNLYPQSKLKQYLLPFAVSHPVNLVEDINSILFRYNLPEIYFICCNQFWAHKNHRIVLDAINVLKSKGIEVFVVFTGKEYDYRNPDFFKQLLAYAETLGIKNNIRFLGFIPREDQLSLIKYSLAIIQPSLFEGWSTVIEDAKSLQSLILASKIEVHVEQLSNYPNKYFFSSFDEKELANFLVDILLYKKVKVREPYLYEKNVIEFGKKFLDIIDNVLEE